MFGNTRPVLTFGIINAALASSKLPPRVSEIDRHNIQRVQQALKSSAAVGARVLRAKSLWSYLTLRPLWTIVSNPSIKSGRERSHYLDT